MRHIIIRRDDRGFYTYETERGMKQFQGCTSYSSREAAQNTIKVIKSDEAAFKPQETVVFYDDRDNTPKQAEW